MTIHNFLQAKRLAALSMLAAVIPAASAQLILADNFNVAGGNSPTTGFGVNGVNYQISSRLSGNVFTANPGLSLIQTNTGKAASAFSITNNFLRVTDATGAGALQYSTGGVAFNFGSLLAGETYEIKLTLALGETETTSRRASFYINDVNTSDVGTANYAFQIASNAGTSQGPQSVYKRLDGAANSTGSDINQSVLSGIAFNSLVDFRLLITDSTDYASGIYASTYQLYVNDTLADSGNFRFNSDNRYLIFDVAPSSNPARFDNFSVTVLTAVPEPSATALGIASFLAVLVAFRRLRSS